MGRSLFLLPLLHFASCDPLRCISNEECEEGALCEEQCPSNTSCHLSYHSFRGELSVDHIGCRGSIDTEQCKVSHNECEPSHVLLRYSEVYLSFLLLFSLLSPKASLWVYLNFGLKITELRVQLSTHTQSSQQ